MSGRVIIAGAGCGDYDLITMRGYEALKSCDVVIYDSLIDSRLLDFCKDGAEKICVGKRAGRHSSTQEEINTLLVEKAAEGGVVLRLKGGDPFVFGRGGEEITALEVADIPCSLITRGRLPRWQCLSLQVYRLATGDFQGALQDDNRSHCERPAP